VCSDIKRWCRQCDSCARAKAGPGVGKSPLHQSVTGAPLNRIAVDIVSPLPQTADGNEYLVGPCDYFTKWVEAYAVPDHTALTVGDKIVNEFMFLSRYILIKDVSSNQNCFQYCVTY
jgi:hypothetical protein